MEFKGKAGTIYVQKAKDTDDGSHEVWFEDFCIGIGPSKREALENAVRHTADMNNLVGEALLATVKVENAGLKEQPHEIPN